MSITIIEKWTFPLIAYIWMTPVAQTANDIIALPAIKKKIRCCCLKNDNARLVIKQLGIIDKKLMRMVLPSELLISSANIPKKFIIQMLMDNEKLLPQKMKAWLLFVIFLCKNKSLAVKAAIPVNKMPIIIKIGLKDNNISFIECCSTPLLTHFAIPCIIFSYYE